MFGLFKNKRREIETWEINVLQNIAEQLPEEYKYLRSQLQDGILRKARTDSDVISNYVDFSYNPEVVNKYDNMKMQDFRLTGIEVYDEISSGYIYMDIYVASGLIAGYSTSKSKPRLDPSRIKMVHYKKVYLENADFDSIKHLLNTEELKLINPSAVYEVVLKGKTYYHLKDLEDGDFIGIDENKQLYRIMHDPYEITLIDRDLTSVMTDNGK